MKRAQRIEFGVVSGWNPHTGRNESCPVLKWQGASFVLGPVEGYDTEFDAVEALASALTQILRSSRT